MFDILTIIPGKKKKTHGGWTAFNAVCCSHLGHRSDDRSRGGIHSNGNSWSYHCFNCGYKTGFTLGKSISYKTRQLLKWCGIDDSQIGRWNLESLAQKDFLDFTQPTKPKLKIKFEDHELPKSEMVDHANPAHSRYVDYVQSRGISISDYPFLVTPDDPGRMGNRIIVPYTYNGKIVGHTSRFLDDKIPKYINEQQAGYVFNIDVQKPEWVVCILTEGIFDALAIDGVAVMHDDISNEQSLMLGQLNRPIIVVPDRDRTGLKITDRALELGYQVSLPNWEADIKDVNDAVVRYGKLPTLLSILQSATTSKIKIELRKKQIAKGL